MASLQSLSPFPCVSLPCIALSGERTRSSCPVSAEDKGFSYGCLGSQSGLHPCLRCWKKTTRTLSHLGFHLLSESLSRLQNVLPSSSGLFLLLQHHKNLSYFSELSGCVPNLGSRKQAVNSGTVDTGITERFGRYSRDHLLSSSARDISDLSWIFTPPSTRRKGLNLALLTVLDL